MFSLNVIIIVTFFTTLIFIFAVWFSVVIWTVKSGISPMPTSEKVKKRVLATIPPETQGTVVDLGSGWGNIAMQMAYLLPQCHVVGYEISPIPWFISKMWKLFNKVPNVEFLHKDFSNVPLQNVSLVYCYLFPNGMKKLAKKFDEELRPGTIVISNTFAVPGWDPIQVLNVQDIYNTRIYVYVKSTSNIEALHAKPLDPKKNEGEKLMAKG